MTTKKFVSTILILTLVSCNNNQIQERPKQDPPKALGDKSSSSDVISKRGYDDLVESLYSELVNKNIDLKELETKIDDLNTSRSDTAELFDKYDKKNQTYFSSADRHMSEIKDSILRNRMKVLIANQLTKYNSSIAKHKELLKIIEEKEMTIADLHTIVKIVKTLPLIDTYQKNNIPTTKSFEGYIKQQDEALKLADTISKK